MPEFKKSRGYKMKGYSYPGTSPLKGKKAKLRAQSQRDAAAAMQEQFEAGKIQEQTNIVNQPSAIDMPSPVKQEAVSGSDMTEAEREQFSIDQANEKFGEKGVEVKGNEETDTSTDDMKDVGSEAAGMDWGELGQGLAAQAGGALINAGIERLTRKKEKPKSKGPDVSGFSGIKFGA